MKEFWNEMNDLSFTEQSLCGFKVKVSIEGSGLKYYGITIDAFLTVTGFKVKVSIEGSGLKYIEFVGITIDAFLTFTWQSKL